MTLPKAGRYILGCFFCPLEAEATKNIQAALTEVAASMDLTVLAFREVPVNPKCLGPTAFASRPNIVHMAMVPNYALPSKNPTEVLERVAFIFRKKARKAVKAARTLAGRVPRSGEFHFASLSSRTIVYKGQLLAPQVPQFYPDLTNPSFVSDMAMVHSRFATNTFPSWERSQPNRCMSHNGVFSVPKPLRIPTVARLSLATHSSNPLFSWLSVVTLPRRNQLAAGQPQLDEGAPGPAEAGEAGLDAGGG